MKTKPDVIPKVGGVYVICHRATNSIYIGSSVQLRARYIEWKCAFKRGRADRFPSQNADEYTFEVVKLTGDLGLQELRDLETKIIEGAKKRGLTVLNKIKPAAMLHYEVDGILGSASAHARRLGLTPCIVSAKLAKGYTLDQALGREPRPPCSMEQLKAQWRKTAIDNMPVKLFDPAGNALTYKEAAALAGRGVETMKQRVRRAREDDKTLIAMTINPTDVAA